MRIISENSSEDTKNTKKQKKMLFGLTRFNQKQ